MKGKKTGGRKAGTPNKITTTFKELVTTTFQALQEDKNANLLAWAKRNPEEFYKIASRLIPTELTGTVVNKVIEVVVKEEEPKPPVQEIKLVS